MCFGGNCLSLVRIKSGQVSTLDTVACFCHPCFVSVCRFLSSNVRPASAEKNPFAFWRPARCARFFLRVRSALVRLFFGVSGSVGRRFAVQLSFSAVFGAATLL